MMGFASISKRSTMVTARVPVPVWRGGIIWLEYTAERFNTELLLRFKNFNFERSPPQVGACHSARRVVGSGVVEELVTGPGGGI